MTTNVLFLCTGNSARSILAEALLGVLGRGRFKAYSAGSHPSGRVQPMAADLATKLGYPPEKLRSKSWDEYAKPGAPRMDFIITVCDNAAGETCPVWPGRPALAHWGTPDPAITPDDTEAFKEAWLILRRRIELLLALPIEKLDRIARERGVLEIAEPAK